MNTEQIIKTILATEEQRKNGERRRGHKKLKQSTNFCKRAKPYKAAKTMYRKPTSC